MFDYDEKSPESILEYAKRLEGLTFLDVLELYCANEGVSLESEQIKDTRAKGQLGNFLEKYYFGYDNNGRQEADFKAAGVELKQTCIDIKKDGSYTAGERLSITNISYKEPVEPNFDKSHVWEKIRRMLLVHYIRDKTISRMLYKIQFVNLFTPPKEDLDIIIEDYKKIIEKLVSGKAHEISESDTLYLGACTKGANAQKSTVPQYYGEHILARKRNFCLKRNYMDFVLHQYVLRDSVPYERVIKGDLGTRSFEAVILERITRHVGMSDQQLCEFYDREYNNNKAQWVDLSYRMLGIKGNHAEEFEKANIVVKAIRLEENGKMKESMSFPPFQFLDLIKQDWEGSDVFKYFSETKFLFVVYKKKTNKYLLQGTCFWNMPITDLDGEVREGWETVKDTIKQGVRFKINPNGTVSNNLPSKNDNRIIHVRPHAKKAAYSLANGFVRGNVERDANQLPDGQWMTTQSFWINNDYILEQLKIKDMEKTTSKKNILTSEMILERLSLYETNPAVTDFKAINREPIRQLKENFSVLGNRSNLRKKIKQCICIYTTSKGEFITYCSNGDKYSTVGFENELQLDTSIYIKGDKEINHIGTEDIWNMFYELSEKDSSLIACVALVFYHMSRKTGSYKEFKMLFETDENRELSFDWKLPCFDNDIISSLNELIGDIVLQKGNTISFEAFIYYWELEISRRECLPQESATYFRDRRGEICNLVIGIADYYMGFFSYGKLLGFVKDGMKFVFQDMISAATKGAVHYVEEEFKNFLIEEKIKFINKSSLKLEDTSIPCWMCIPNARIVVSRNYLSDIDLRFLERSGWKEIVLQDITDGVALNATIQLIKNRL